MIFDRAPTLEEFLAAPTRDQWQAALAEGWPGPDGSSMSTDRMCGVRIGITSRAYMFHDLPANRHDWRYLLGRTYRLGAPFRLAADEGYRDMCVERFRQRLVQPRLAEGIVRAHIRFAVLRLGARFAWTEKTQLRHERWHGDGSASAE